MSELEPLLHNASVVTTTTMQLDGASYPVEGRVQKRSRIIFIEDVNLHLPARTRVTVEYKRRLKQTAKRLRRRVTYLSMCTECFLHSRQVSSRRCSEQFAFFFAGDGKTRTSLANHHSHTTFGPARKLRRT